MANKMLIDAAHPEETRVVVVRGQRVEEFDFESAQRKPLRGNIYLAKVMRVEPSLQAAFVDYGGNRHGFLAFSEIHPDYYQIPVADREALIAEEARSARESEDDEPGPRRSRSRRGGSAARRHDSPSVSADDPVLADEAPVFDGDASALPPAIEQEVAGSSQSSPTEPDIESSVEAVEQASDESEIAEAVASEASPAVADVEAPLSVESSPPDEALQSGPDSEIEAGSDPVEQQDPPIELLGAGDGLEEVPERRRPPRRNYKIQEVIKRRQIILVQVVKEERGNKGAALTTYLSLAGRYSVLMPNTARGGGISRKITNAPDRKRLKAVAGELDVPEGMGVIVRTAGAARTKAEIKRDFEYLLRLWENVRELTLKSSAPALVHEEGSLIKRAIRDLYNKEIDEILVAGEEGYKEAKDFMRMLAPSHAKAVKLYKETEPVFARFGVERQLDAMFSNMVTLRSGGYVVINQTEALVAIDVNSGRATREHNIEDTALKTNLEAAEEVARQLRLRDLAGLIVIDFIDMDEKRNNRSVEKRLKDCLKSDRARIQVGHISPFGLLEMSRQRIRSGVVEGSSTPCPHCGGAGRVRSTPSVALHVLRHVEDSLVRNASRNLIVRTRTDIAFYVLNQKRGHLRQIEDRFGLTVNFVADDKHNGVDFFSIEQSDPVALRGEANGREANGALQPQASDSTLRAGEQEQTDDRIGAQVEEGEPRSLDDSPQKRRRRRRRRRGGERDLDTTREQPLAANEEADRLGGHGDEGQESVAAVVNGHHAEASAEGGDQRRRRRRGRRGGGGRERRDEGVLAGAQTQSAALASDIEDASVGDGEQLAVAALHPAENVDAPLTGAEVIHVESSEAVNSVEPASAHVPTEPDAPGARSDSTHIQAGTENGELAAQPAPEEATSEPAARDSAVVSTYDPTKTKRAGWWSKARSTLAPKD
jgi:ribonuclease E